jgi:hypothetical protein
MSHKRKGQLTSEVERAKHLGKYLKRVFWKGERKAEKKLISKVVKTDITEMAKKYFKRH